MLTKSSSKLIKTLTTKVNTLTVKVDGLLLYNDIESLLTDYDFDYAYLAGFRTIPNKATVNEWNIDTVNGVAKASGSLTLAETQLTNGDFETGDFTGWTVVGGTYGPYVTYDYPIEGTYSAEFGCDINDLSALVSGSIEQSISLPRKAYVLNFKYRFTSNAPLNEVKVMFPSPNDTTTIKFKFQARGDPAYASIKVYADNTLVFSDETTSYNGIQLDSIKIYNTDLLKLQNLDGVSINAIYLAANPVPTSSDMLFFATDGTVIVELTPNTIQDVNLSRLDVEAYFYPLSTFELDNLAIMWRRA